MILTLGLRGCWGFGALGHEEPPAWLSIGPQAAYRGFPKRDSKAGESGFSAGKGAGNLPEAMNMACGGSFSRTLAVHWTLRSGAKTAQKFGGIHCAEFIEPRTKRSAKQAPKGAARSSCMLSLGCTGLFVANWRWMGPKTAK